MRCTQKSNLARPGQVLRILINGQDGFSRYEWYPLNSVVEVEFYEPETEEEIAAAHPGQRRMPDASRRYPGREVESVAEEFREAGFRNINLDCHYKAKKTWLIKEGAVFGVSVNGQTRFEKGEWFDEDAVIRISYYSYGTGGSRP